MSISERLERNLITDIKGLTRQEEDELLYWAKEIKKMKWKDIRSRFKFKLEENTLRGRLWHYQIKKDLKKPPPRKAIFTERDVSYLFVLHLPSIPSDTIRYGIWQTSSSHLHR